MDGNRFDDITRRLAAGTSRRSLLKRSLAAAAALAGIGAAGSAGAARRPTPTPRPVTCPGSQMWDGTACTCPSGDICGSECCEIGSTCCDGACCNGTCYGEERCCPTGQIVCEGRCLDPGQCCIDGDCPLGWACGIVAPNICTCVPTVTCASIGQNCGSLTDDCGNPLDCGICQAPNTCGGGGTPGVCGCTVTTTCDGQCGEIATNCNTTLSCDPCQEPEPCGGLCGPCQTCSDNTCVEADIGTFCFHDCSFGSCFAGDCHIFDTIQCPGREFGIENPDESCNTYQCVPDPANSIVQCVATPDNDGGSCQPEDECQTGICRNGSCVGTDIECGLCQTCRDGSCEPTTGDSCGTDHRCIDGICSHFPSGDPPAGVDVNGICSQLKCTGACCPGLDDSTCCDSMDDCFLNDNGGFLNGYCCDPGNKCGSNCCWSGKSCAGGTVCRPDEMICADDPFCPEACCGGNGGAGSGTCCPSGQRCQNGACVAVPTGACNSDAECPSGALCAGLVKDRESGAVITAGSCCLSDYVYTDIAASQDAGQAVYGCCAAPFYVGDPAGGASCCSYSDSQCQGCTCSTTTVRRWGH